MQSMCNGCYNDGLSVEESSHCVEWLCCAHQQCTRFTVKIENILSWKSTVLLHEIT